MPARLIPLVNEEFYHIYNRGVASQPVFLTKRDYERFILCLSYYQFQNTPIRISHFLRLTYDERSVLLSNLENGNLKTIELIAFCLMPNHFHLLVKQASEGGISTFLKKITDSYTRYFNVKNDRVGPLFQGSFKAVHIENNEQLMHVSRYIHLNPLVSYLVKEDSFLSYSWSSLPEYLNGNSKLINSKPVLENFKTADKYLQFVLDQADYGKQLEQIKHIKLE